jgi:hypothetical protein
LLNLIFLDCNADLGWKDVFAILSILLRRGCVGRIVFLSINGGSMAQYSSQFSRRRFLFTAGASTAATILLKGCMGNPPDTATGTQSPVAASPVALAPGTEPEVTAASLGYIPIVEAAPLIVAKEKGFFANMA